jgi:hypothetical protein
VQVVPTFNGNVAGNWKYDPCALVDEPDIVIPPHPLKIAFDHGVVLYPVKWLAWPDLSFQDETVVPFAGLTRVPAGSSPSNHTIQLGMFVGENGMADNGLTT